MELLTKRPSWLVRPIVGYVIATILFLFSWMYYGFFSAFVATALFVLLDFLGRRWGSRRSSARVIFYSRLGAIGTALVLPGLVSFAFDINDALNCESSPNCTVVKPK
jgi:hypothetical protein